MWEFIRYSRIPDNELYHFKYVKRVKGPDGKYRYYYADQATHDRIANNMSSATGHKLRSSLLLNDSRKLLKDSKKYSKKSREGNQLFVGNRISDNRKSLDKLYESQVANIEASKEARRSQQIVDAQEKYTVSAQTKAAIQNAKNKGKAFLSKFIRKGTNTATNSANDAPVKAYLHSGRNVSRKPR